MANLLLGVDTRSLSLANTVNSFSGASPEDPYLPSFLYAYEDPSVAGSRVRSFHCSYLKSYKQLLLALSGWKMKFLHSKKICSRIICREQGTCLALSYHVRAPMISTVFLPSRERPEEPSVSWCSVSLASPRPTVIISSSHQFRKANLDPLFAKYFVDLPIKVLSLDLGAGGLSSPLTTSPPLCLSLPESSVGVEIQNPFRSHYMGDIVIEMCNASDSHRERVSYHWECPKEPFVTSIYLKRQPLTRFVPNFLLTAPFAWSVLVDVWNRCVVGVEENLIEHNQVYQHEVYSFGAYVDIMQMYMTIEVSNKCSSIDPSFVKRSLTISFRRSRERSLLSSFHWERIPFPSALFSWRDEASPLDLLFMSKANQTSSCRGHERSIYSSSSFKERTCPSNFLSSRETLLSNTVSGKMFNILIVLHSCVKVCLGPVDAARFILVKFEVMDRYSKPHDKLAHQKSFEENKVSLLSFLV